MGCDIHFVVEQKFTTFENKPKWVGILSTEYYTRSQYHKDSPMTVLRARNYGFFAALCGVRSYGTDFTDREPNGPPDDVSDLTIAHINKWGEDAHSESHCSLEHFIRTWAITDSDASSERLKGADPIQKTTELLIGDQEVEDFRVCYWFDN